MAVAVIDMVVIELVGVLEGMGDIAVVVAIVVVIWDVELPDEAVELMGAVVVVAGLVELGDPVAEDVAGFDAPVVTVVAGLLEVLGFELPEEVEAMELVEPGLEAELETAVVEEIVPVPDDVPIAVVGVGLSEPDKVVWEDVCPLDVDTAGVVDPDPDTVVAEVVVSLL